MDEEQSRRDAIEKLGWCCLGASGVGAAVYGYEFLSPNVLYEPSPVVNAGPTGQFPQLSVTPYTNASIYIVHGDHGLYALSATCTHLGCHTAWVPELDLIACPCHGSRFNRHGIKVAGPAPQPLPWLKLWIADTGDVMVDRSIVLPSPKFVRIT